MGGQSLHVFETRLVGCDKSFNVLALNDDNGIDVNLWNLEGTGSSRELIDDLGRVEIGHDLDHVYVDNGKGRVGYRGLQFGCCGLSGKDRSSAGH